MSFYLLLTNNDPRAIYVYVMFVVYCMFEKVLKADVLNLEMNKKKGEAWGKGFFDFIRAGALSAEPAYNSVLNDNYSKAEKLKSSEVRYTKAGGSIISFLLGVEGRLELRDYYALSDGDKKLGFVKIQKALLELSVSPEEIKGRGMRSFLQAFCALYKGEGDYFIPMHWGTVKKTLSMFTWCFKEVWRAQHVHVRMQGGLSEDAGEEEVRKIYL